MAKTNLLLRLTPEQFEKYVVAVLKQEGIHLHNFEISHLLHVQGVDGDYELDGVATFTAFGNAEFRVLIECKRYSHAVNRDIVMLMNQKLQSTGSHKGMIFSTSGFQSGAIEFANVHKIALIHVKPGMYHVFIVNTGEKGMPDVEGDPILDEFSSYLETTPPNSPLVVLDRPAIYPGRFLLKYLDLETEASEKPAKSTPK